jgi:chromosome segregation ATPase
LDKERLELRKANSKISSLYSRLEIKDQQILDLKAIEQDARIERQGWLSRIEHVEEQLDLFEKKHTELDESNTHLQKMFEELGDTNEQLRTEVEFLERRNNHLQKIAMDREALIKELRAKVSESKNEDEKDAQINTLTMLVNKQNTTLKEACGNLIDPITAELSSNLVLLESGQPISLEGIVTIWMNMENFSGDPYSAIPCPTTRLLVGPVKDQGILLILNF